MKAVILAGGQRSAISNEREGIPKPMAEIGGKPLIWHIMKHFSEYGIKEFVVCGGYRVDMIKDYFMDFYIYESDITVDLLANTVTIHKKKTEDWKVTVVDTGLFSSTGQRVDMIQKYITEDGFFVTYGDCLTDISVSDMIRVFEQRGKMALMAVAKPGGRNELLPIDEDGTIRYGQFQKIKLDRAWINADCFLFRKDIFRYLQGNYDLEKQLLIKLSELQELELYRHEGFWISVETKRDLVNAENMWNAGKAPWIKNKGSVEAAL